METSISNTQFNALEIKRRNHINILGEGEHVILLAHGFGCSQNMWRFLTPYLEKHYKVVLFDYVGSGNSDVRAYQKNRYSQLEGYALDVIEICDSLDFSNVLFVGHSVGATIGLITAHLRPDLIDKLVMVCPSPCFLNLNDGYSGGFEKSDLEELVNLMDKNYIGWGNYLAPLVMNSIPSATDTEQETDDVLVQELLTSFCSTDPTYSKPFAIATFFSDYRHLLPKIHHPCLVIQSKQDALVPIEVGKYTQKQLPNAKLDIINGKGHCLHMTYPSKVLNSILDFIDQTQ
ncbi:Sigma factor SigB regulation protein RsbQ [Marinomonas spartinae]|uniref:alpha/beta fold hydrolase n=1 Tax=Marinomonas spartinae TaxID=1792290 RepID=UPI000808BEF0|nr:alpha/beta hydrolase [Marinomonas spartinae]SBS31827.1 Sigma factor SigB regulation protein RsbQ [Marinomonas spartinae]